MKLTPTLVGIFPVGFPSRFLIPVLRGGGVGIGGVWRLIEKGGKLRGTREYLRIPVLRCGLQSMFVTAL